MIMLWSALPIFAADCVAGTADNVDIAGGAEGDISAAVVAAAAIGGAFCMIGTG